MSKDFAKTVSFLALHLIVGFSVAYLLTGSVVIAGGIALIEPVANSVVFFFHERAWDGRLWPMKAVRAAPNWRLG
jgi:uncharacterized membrane protein